MKIGMDVHKETVYVTAMEEDGSIREQYEMKNSYEEWRKFKDKHTQFKPDIAVETSTSGCCKAVEGHGFLSACG